MAPVFLTRPLPSFSFAMAAIPISYRYTIPKTFEDSVPPSPVPADLMTTVDLDSESVDFDYYKLSMPYLFEDDDDDEALDFCVDCLLENNGPLSRVNSGKRFWLLRLMIFIRKLVGKNHTSFSA